MAAVIFVLVSAGPFGVEEMVGAAGPGVALLLLLLVPVVWGAPLALVCAELAAAIPAEGGAYVWIERGLGRFWAFQSGWWTTLSTTLDTTLYVVLAVTYGGGRLADAPLTRWLLSVGLIALFAALNVRSLASMARSSVAFSVVILVPCAALTVLGLAGWQASPFVPLTPPGTPVAASLGLGLTVAIWFYSGYESMSTMAGEVAEPQRVIPRALLLSLPVVVAVYVLPTAAGLASVGRWAEWGVDGGLTLTDVAAALGGPALAALTAVAAVASSLALYNGYLASSARTTWVMARSRLLPPVLGRVHPRWGTPHVALLVAATLHAALAATSFEALLVIDVFLFVMNYLLVFVTVVVLRVREPALPRPFRVPVGTTGLAVVAGVPALVGLVFLVANGPLYLLWGSLVAATGPLAWLVVGRLVPNPGQAPPGDGA